MDAVYPHSVVTLDLLPLDLFSCLIFSTFNFFLPVSSLYIEKSTSCQDS